MNIVVLQILIRKYETKVRDMEYSWGQGCHHVQALRKCVRALKNKQASLSLYKSSESSS